MKKTNERLLVTTGGWDGTGYDGEGKERPVYVNDKGEKFVKGRGYKGQWCYLKVTEKRHEVSGLIEVEYYDYQ